MAGRLPDAVVQGKKRGFNVPMPSWLAGELREFASDLLSPTRVKDQGLFDPNEVQRLLGEHVSRRFDHSRPLWTLLVLAVWHQEVLRGTRPTASRAAGASA
jgi:asparagine synthase (glutamine-hydrolysing)